MTFQQESIGDLIPEVMPMLEQHYEELTLNKDVVKLDPKWDDYRALEGMGRFVVLTAREHGQLVAYNAFFLNTHMHYSDLMVAVNDVFYIHPDYRRGSLALRFLRHTEQALKSIGAQKVAYHCKRGNNFAAILRSRLLGYQDEEGVVGKII